MPQDVQPREVVAIDQRPRVVLWSSYRVLDLTMTERVRQLILSNGDLGHHSAVGSSFHEEPRMEDTGSGG